jgi:hypothetical protein
MLVSMNAGWGRIPVFQFDVSRTDFSAGANEAMERVTEGGENHPSAAKAGFILLRVRHG